ncbi:HIT family protein [Nocardioides solisilvae]|uniref:HIT family protein n=1 Tax=Nocardioides solisilvae TaxID=1542435 RepID=UPI000D74C9BF|nr:HIT domain-containing protein [Nocardioides solisilvae]
MTADCLFCGIVRGEVEASFVHRDEQVVAFLDVHPVRPGHLLVAPVAHHAGVTDLPEGTGAHLWSVARRLAVLVARLPGTEGINLLMSQGTAAQQSVPHSHLHVIPRAPEDGMTLASPPRPYDRTALDEVAAQLRHSWKEGS